MLGRRILTDVRYVCEDDPAIDPASHAAYAEALYDWSKLTLVPGQAPTVFVLRSLPYRYRLQLAGDMPSEVKMDVAFRAGVKAIENPLNGTGEPKFKNGLIDPEWMDGAALLMKQVGEVAGAVVRISELPDPLSGR